MSLLVLINSGNIFFLYENAGDINKIQDVAESGGVLGKIVTKKKLCNVCLLIFFLLKIGSVFALLSKVMISILKRKEIISFSDNIKQQ